MLNLDIIFLNNHARSGQFLSGQDLLPFIFSLPTFWTERYILQLTNSSSHSLYILLSFIYISLLHHTYHIKMASAFSSSSAITFLLALATLALCVSPAFSASAGFKVKLKSVDFGKNLSTFERVLHGMKRGQHRLQRFNAMSLAASDTASDLKSPVHAGTGEYLMDLSIGSPAVSFSAILDTGSDLIWTQCKPCQVCFDQATPIFDPKESSSYSKIPCSSALCKALPQQECNANNACEYIYSYGDTSSSQGVLATETFTFGDVSVPNIGFGCGSDNEGDGFSQGAGLVGLGRDHCLSFHNSRNQNSRTA